MSGVIRRRFASVCAAILGLSAGLATANDHGGGDPRIVPGNAVIEGRTYHEWAAAWWQWALSFPPATNPVIDSTGASAGEGQSGAVYFLAGTFGGTVVRNITVPPGLYFFLPVANAEWDTVPGLENPLDLPDPLSVQDLRRITAYSINNTVAACWIDGVRVANLANFRARSPVFSFNQDPELAAEFGYPAPYVRTAVADGYWLMIKPLRPGRHTVRFTARNARSNFALDVTYNITITSNRPTAR